jgi:hypothetical protein
MANGVFNVALGRVNELMLRVENNDPTNSAIIIVLLKTAEADATLEDYDDLSALLAGSNVEADFTGTAYARKVLTDADISAPTLDDGANTYYSVVPQQTWTSAGGTVTNTLAKLLVCYDDDSTGGTDANIIPLTHHDYVVTTDGSDLIAQFAASGYYSASM